MATLKIYTLLDFGSRYELSGNYYTHIKTYLQAGVNADGAGGGYVFRTLLKFDFSSLPANIIISNATINLKIRTAQYSGDLPTEYRNLSVNKITEKWTFADLQFKCPSFNSSYESIIGTTALNSWSILNITDYVKAVYASTATDYGLLLKHQVDTWISNDRSYRGFYLPTDATVENRPYIEVTYSYPPPYTPTNLSPADGISLLRNSIINFSWQHNPATAGTAQKRFDLQYRLQGSGTWTTISQTTTSQSYSLPANTLVANGTNEWQVRTYDQNDSVSSYSSTAVFLAGEVPATPIITSPQNNAIIAIPMPSVMWTAATQVAYHIKVTDTTGSTVLWDKVTNDANARSKQIEYILENNAAYRLAVRVRSAEGFWSDYAQCSITTSFPVPPQPTILLEIHDDLSAITITISNPPEGTNPVVTSNQIFRRIQGAAEWDRIAMAVPKGGSYTDYTPAFGTVYEYKVKAVSDNLTFAESAVSKSSVPASEAKLSLTTDYSRCVKVSTDAERKREVSYRVTSLLFAGRNQPVVEFSGLKQTIISLSFLLFEQVDIAMLDFIVDAGKAVLYRDNRGRKVFGVIDSYHVDDAKPDCYKVTLNVSSVYFSEVV